MTPLNLPSYNFKIKNSKNKRLIFDPIRKKFMVLTPEEWVRQHFVSYLISEKNYPISLIAVEKQLSVNGLKKRTDILVFNNSRKSRNYCGMQRRLLFQSLKAHSIKLHATI